MNIVDIIQELLDYLHLHNGNHRTCDAMEECLEMLQSNLSVEQREREIKRVGETLSFLVNQEQHQQEEVFIKEQEKKLFIEKIRKKIEECSLECRNMANRKSIEQSHLIQGYENEFMTEMNAELNGNAMQEKEKIMQLVDRSRLRLSDNVRLVVKEFTQNVMDEYEFCMEKIRKTFTETKIKEFHKSHSEIYNDVMTNYDSMQRNIQAESDAYMYPDGAFHQFAEKIGTQMEKIATRHRYTYLLLKLLPLIIFLIKYVVENYIIQKETWADKLLAFLEQLIMNSSTSEQMTYKIAEIIVMFAQDYGAVFEFTFEFLLFFFFLGWLYYIYLKIINYMKKKSLYHKQQAIISSASKEFLQNLNIKEEINKTLIIFEKKIEAFYMQKYKNLFEDLVLDENILKSESKLQELQNAYMEYTKNV